MKIQHIINDTEETFKLIPETHEEKCILGSLRNHYFLGLEERGTYPQYNGITKEDNYVTSMSFKCNKFKS